MESQLIAYLLIGREHTYWIWDLESEVHSIWDLWISGLQECKGNGFFEVGQAGKKIWSGPENLHILAMQLVLPEYSYRVKFVGGT